MIIIEKFEELIRNNVEQRDDEQRNDEQRNNEQRNDEQRNNEQRDDNLYISKDKFNLIKQLATDFSSLLKQKDSDASFQHAMSKAISALDYVIQDSSGEAVLDSDYDDLANNLVMQLRIISSDTNHNIFDQLALIHVPCAQTTNPTERCTLIQANQSIRDILLKVPALAAQAAAQAAAKRRKIWMRIGALGLLLVGSISASVILPGIGLPIRVFNCVVLTALFLYAVVQLSRSFPPTPNPNMSATGWRVRICFLLSWPEQIMASHLHKNFPRRGLNQREKKLPF